MDRGRECQSLFLEIPHSIHSTGDLVSARQMKLNVIWKAEWVEFMLLHLWFLVLASEHSLGRFCFFCMSSNRPLKVQFLVCGHQKRQVIMYPLYLEENEAIWPRFVMIWVEMAWSWKLATGVCFLDSPPSWCANYVLLSENVLNIWIHSINKLFWFFQQFLLNTQL